jgi:hypothetical protein
MQKCGVRVSYQLQVCLLICSFHSSLSHSPHSTCLSCVSTPTLVRNPPCCLVCCILPRRLSHPTHLVFQLYINHVTRSYSQCDGRKNMGKGCDGIQEFCCTQGRVKARGASTHGYWILWTTKYHSQKFLVYSYECFGWRFCLHVEVARVKEEGPGELFYLANKRYGVTSDLTSDSYFVKIQYVSGQIQINSHKEWCACGKEESLLRNRKNFMT